LKCITLKRERIFLLTAHKLRLSLATKSPLVGVAQGFLSEIENGTKTGDVHTLAKIARALSISIDDLVVEQDHQPVAIPGRTKIKDAGKKLKAISKGHALTGNARSSKSRKAGVKRIVGNSTKTRQRS
jgi:transcriptional regulator with XRE-family HTH domain